MTVGATSDGLDAAIFNSGLRSMRIAGLTGKTKTLTQTITDNGSVGLPLRLILYAKGNNVMASGGQVLVQEYVGITVAKTFTFNLPSGTYAFTQRVFDMTSPVAYTKLTVQIKSTDPTGSTIWIDTVSLAHPLIIKPYYGARPFPSVTVP
jgi:hypothetical protein